MKQVRVIVLRAAGTNCDVETAFAFKQVGASVELVHINKLVSSQKKLDNFHILAIPGGFTYGDDIASGKILANEIKCKLKDEIVNFIKSGKPIIGICNGFQVLVKSGFLPNINGDFENEVTLITNDSDKFEDRWVYLKKAKNECIWTKGIEDIIYLPVAHGEGKFVPRDGETLEKLRKNGQIVFTYCDEKGKAKGYPINPNNSVGSIAGICDTSGMVFGLMPHPERHIFHTQHPHWTRVKDRETPPGLRILQNGVKAASKL